MSAFSTRGLKIFLQTTRVTPPTGTVVSLSATKPIVCQTSVPTIFASGDIVKITGTGWDCADDKYFIVRNIDGNATGAPLQIAVSGHATATVTLTVTGGPAASPGLARFFVDTGSGTGLTGLVNFAEGTTAAVAAQAIALYMDTRVAAGVPLAASRPAGLPGTVEITREDGGLFVGFTAQVQGTAILASTGQFELACSDGSSEETANTDGTGTITRYRLSSGFVPFCISSFNRDVPAAEPVSVGTFCDPQAVVSGVAANRGTISWGGPVDFTDLGYCEMSRAYRDGAERLVAIEYPDGRATAVIPIEVNQYSEPLELNAGAVWTGGAIVKPPGPSYIVEEVGNCACTCP